MDTERLQRPAQWSITIGTILIILSLLLLEVPHNDTDPIGIAIVVIAVLGVICCNVGIVILLTRRMGVFTRNREKGTSLNDASETLDEVIAAYEEANKKYRKLTPPLLTEAVKSEWKSSFSKLTQLQQERDDFTKAEHQLKYGTWEPVWEKTSSTGETTYSPNHPYPRWHKALAHAPEFIAQVEGWKNAEKSITQLYGFQLGLAGSRGDTIGLLERDLEEFLTEDQRASTQALKHQLAELSAATESPRFVRLYVDFIHGYNKAIRSYWLAPEMNFLGDPPRPPSITETQFFPGCGISGFTPGYAWLQYYASHANLSR
ncbi:hypothetical protein HMPREF1219_00856 [Corynebacterium pyruviciproducens ATCC BAA-1742]|uniref:DUF5129 domain-containing protein n=1 Tax=Corynebacterium pyruviciproducens ATCC BAA-1742 TaxID=1125779 RepID=S2Z087_9CORY|nr:hypothetical protein [Corynebacterium pyruviciproducens]EPD69911.1 hypothetical protein HMPREF1219_00856 [Corynebacterium pyruviciproducens ATCC BAA-1742]